MARAATPALDRFVLNSCITSPFEGRCRCWCGLFDGDDAGHGRRMDGAVEREFAGRRELELEVLSLRDGSGVELVVGFGGGGTTGLLYPARCDGVAGHVVLEPGDRCPDRHVELGRIEG